jgi:hypothetical protein
VVSADGINDAIDNFRVCFQGKRAEQQLRSQHG